MDTLERLPFIPTSRQKTHGTVLELTLQLCANICLPALRAQVYFHTCDIIFFLFATENLFIIEMRRRPAFNRNRPVALTVTTRFAKSGRGVVEVSDKLGTGRGSVAIESSGK